MLSANTEAMAPLSIRSFPRAILHVDGDAFFALCEQMQNPSLRGKPVITGLERGIASSMSYEAKARGVTRAMSLRDIRRVCPDAIILPSDYELYSLMSMRMYDIVRRYPDAVEEAEKQAAKRVSQENDERAGSELALEAFLSAQDDGQLLTTLRQHEAAYARAYQRAYRHLRELREDGLAKLAGE